jgi:hypothetical protein
MYDIPFDRLFLQLSNGIRHAMPSTDTKPELTAKASMAQPVSQPSVYANGLNTFTDFSKWGKPAFLIVLRERVGGCVCSPPPLILIAKYSELLKLHLN